MAKLTKKQEELIRKSVKLTVEKYGDILKKLASE